MLYQVFTGRMPFSGSRQELFDEILNREPKPPRQIDGSIPREVERICLKCLSKRMTDRYTTAFDLAEDLGYWLSRQPEASLTAMAEPERASAAVSGSERCTAFVST